MAGPNAFVLQGSRSVASSRLRLAQIDFPYAPLVPTSYDASSSRRRYLAESGTRALPSTISCLSTLAARERRHLRDWRQRRFETYIEPAPRRSNDASHRVIRPGYPRFMCATSCTIAAMAAKLTISGAASRTAIGRPRDMAISFGNRSHCSKC